MACATRSKSSLRRSNRLKPKPVVRHDPCTVVRKSVGRKKVVAARRARSNRKVAKSTEEYSDVEEEEDDEEVEEVEEEMEEIEYEDEDETMSVYAASEASSDYEEPTNVAPSPPRKRPVKAKARAEIKNTATNAETHPSAAPPPHFGVFQSQPHPIHGYKPMPPYRIAPQNHVYTPSRAIQNARYRAANAPINPSPLRAQVQPTPTPELQSTCGLQRTEDSSPFMGDMHDLWPELLPPRPPASWANVPYYGIIDVSY